MKLLEGRLDRGVFINRILQFNDSQRQAIDKQDYVRALVDVVLDHRELVDHQKIIVLGILEINEPNQVAPAAAIILNGDLMPYVSSRWKTSMFAITSGKMSR